MSAETIKPKAAGWSVDALGRVLHDRTRWCLLRELAKGQPLPVVELAKRVGLEAALTSKHMAVLRRENLVERVYETLYRLVPQAKPSADGRRLDLGPCVLKFDAF